MSTERKYQFTTNDGIDIYAGDYYYGVWDDGRIVRAKADPMGWWDPKANRFSTEEAAIDFVKSRNQKP